MVLFELLQLMRVFLDYLRIEYLWHVLIMPLTNRNGITICFMNSSSRLGYPAPTAPSAPGDTTRGLLLGAQPSPITVPALSPRWRPDSMTSVPLTKTWEIPSAKRFGS